MQRREEEQNAQSIVYGRDNPAPTNPIGSNLGYYRRRNGDLMRSIRRPDGTVRKWVIGWTDLAPYEQYTSSEDWRDD